MDGAQKLFSLYVHDKFWFFVKMLKFSPNFAKPEASVLLILKISTRISNFSCINIRRMSKSDRIIKCLPLKWGKRTNTNLQDNSSQLINKNVYSDQWSSAQNILTKKPLIWTDTDYVCGFGSVMHKRKETLPFLPKSLELELINCALFFSYTKHKPRRREAGDQFWFVRNRTIVFLEIIWFSTRWIGWSFPFM